MKSESKDPGGSNQETLDIFTSFTQGVFFQLTTALSLCENSIKSFHIGQAHWSQLHFRDSSFQSVFPDHTTVVI